jgi:hypothetical protein
VSIVRNIIKLKQVREAEEKRKAEEYLTEDTTAVYDEFENVWGEIKIIPFNFYKYKTTELSFSEPPKVIWTEFMALSEVDEWSKTFQILPLDVENNKCKIETFSISEYSNIIETNPPEIIKRNVRRMGKMLMI